MIKWLYIIACVFLAAAAADFLLIGESDTPNYVAIQPKSMASMPSVKSQKPKANIEESPPQRPDTTQFDTVPTLQAQKTPQLEVHASSTSDVCPPILPDEATAINHFGQHIRLNGANIAWSRDALYARDVGTGYVDLRAFKRHFASIAEAGGNSARWWLHTNGTVTPHIDPTGRVVGLSAEKSNAEVIAQIRSVLDAAWEAGILVNITLFSFDLMCQADRLDAHHAMLNQHYQSYIDNALTPMVMGLKDHPALLAWEIFNEAEGMSLGTSFFSDPNLQNCATGREQSPRVLQRFVNHASARIHAIDPNVKVTTSVGHPNHLENYSNHSLLSQPFSKPSGSLDFYQIHWYDGERNPFILKASGYQQDRPIVVGEYSFNGAANTSLGILRNGYAGAWVWSQTTEGRSAVDIAIGRGRACTPVIDKTEILRCIKTRDKRCYN